MGLFDKIKGEFIDIVEWTGGSSDTIAWKFERYNNEIKNGAKLTVREGQVAVFINEGKLADVFEPGMYELTTANLPILSTLKGWKYGFESPFKADVYFINTTRFTDQKWGTKNPIMIDDAQFGLIDVRAFGNYVFKVNDPGMFITTLVGTDGAFTNEEITGQLRSMVVSKFSDAMGEASLPIAAWASQYTELSELIQNVMLPHFQNYGLELCDFLIENISMPDEVKKEIMEYSRLNRIDLAKLTQLKTAKAIEAAAANQGAGGAGAGMGMGMGFAMANQMAQSLGGQPQAQSQTVNNGGGQAPTAGGPPPLPNAVQYYIANGSQRQGPFEMGALKEMITNNQITKDTLVWKEGMSAWQKAAEVADVNSLFGSVPPPLPQ